MIRTINKNRRTALMSLLTAVSLTLVSSQGFGVNQEQHKHEGDGHKAHSSATHDEHSKEVENHQSAPYLLSTCIVSGEELGTMGEPIIFNHNNREIRFCCQSCVEKFEADSAGYLKKIDAEITKQQLPLYPLETCIVSGEKLGGDMGEPIDYVHNNRLIRFCCNMCVNEFNKDQEKFLSKLDQEVIAKQKPNYPLTTCVVSGDKLGGDMGEPIDVVIGNRLVRVCCKGCIKPLQENPLKYFTEMDAKTKASGKDQHDHSAHKH